MSQQRPRRRHTDEFRKGAVDLVTQQGYSVHKAAQAVDVHDSVLRDWAVRPASRGGLRTLRRRLGSCVRDAYVRKAPKERVRWATKRGQNPPGRPKITAATAAQVAAAASLLHTSTTS